MTPEELAEGLRLHKAQQSRDRGLVVLFGIGLFVVLVTLAQLTNGIRNELHGDGWVTGYVVSDQRSPTYATNGIIQAGDDTAHAIAPQPTQGTR